MIRNMFGGTKCRTIDKVDIFNDGSGVALYQLDGNANDTGGNYHGTETAITYGGGVYERAISSAGVAKLQTGLFNYNTPNSISFFAKGQVRYENGRSNLAVPNIQITNTAVLMYSSNSNTGSEVVRLNIAINEPCTVFTHFVVTINYPAVIVYINGVQKYSGTMSGMTTASVYASGFFDISGFGISYTGMIDQVRIFNRAITATEVATLYAECEPTSIVDNINPFMDGSLKALYKFDGDATDATGVYNGTATNVTYGTGKFGQCAVFNGTSSVIGLNIPKSNNIISISCWYKYNSAVGIHLGIGRKSGDAIYVNSYWFRISGFLLFTGKAQIANYAVKDKRILDNVFHHYTVSINGTTAAFYVDGILSETYTLTANDLICLNTYTNFLGIQEETNSWADNGSIDQLRIFNKALTPLEVASLYNETTPLEEPMYKLVDPFRDGSGKALYRLEGNALDESGKYNGTATSVTYGTGQFGRCGVFNGGAYITATGYSLPSSSFAYSFWMNRNSDSAYGIIDCTSRSLIFRNITTGFFNYYAAGAYTTFSFSPLINTTYHITVSVASNSISLYVNGILWQTLSCGIVIPSGTLYLGCIAETTSRHYGTLDQVRIFNRALTATEVTKLYTGENNVL